MNNLLFSLEVIFQQQMRTVSRGWWSKHIQVGLRLPLILGLLLLSIALPLTVSPRQLILLPVLLGAVGTVLVFIRWPPVGLVALIITGLFFPSPRLPGGLNVTVLLAALLIGLWLLDLILSRGKRQFISSRTVWPLLALVAIAALSFGFGQLAWFPLAQNAMLDAQLGGLATFILPVGIFLVVAHQVRDLRWLQWLTWLFVALGALFVAGWLLPPVSQFTNELYHVKATSNSLFWLWLVTLSFSQALLNRTLNIKWRLAAGGVAAATLYVAIVLSYDWKGGWIPALVGVAAIVGFRYWKAGPVLALAGVFVIPAILSRAIATDNYSYGTRMDAWLIMFQIIKVNPLLGFGPANYYWYTPLFPIRGYYVQFNSHNQYIDIVAQIGLLGLACFIWFAWEIGWLGWRLRTRVPEGFAQAYVYGALGGLVGTLAAGVLVDWIFPFIYNIGLEGLRTSLLAWLFLGGLVSIEQIVKHQGRS